MNSRPKRYDINMFQKEINSGVNINNRPPFVHRPIMMFNDMSTNMPNNAEPLIDSDGGNITFTPTTLATLENTLSNLNEDITASFGTTSDLRQRNSESQDLWTTDPADFTGDDDDDGDESEDSSNSAADWSRIKSEIPSCVPGTIDGGCLVEQRPARKLPGPRPARSIDNMTPLEAERRRRRRERNKTAAARCRQRRVELTNELLAETESLERDTTKLEREIDKLRRQKTQLEFVLEAHMPTCRVGGFMLPIVKQESQETLLEGGVSSSVNQAASNYANRPTTLSIPNAASGVNQTQMRNPAAASFGSFDESASGWTPVFTSGEAASPSSYLMLSPTTLLGK